MRLFGKRRDKSPSEETSQTSGVQTEPAGTAAAVRITLALVGGAIVAVAIVLAVRSPSVSSEIQTFNGPAVDGAQPAKVERTRARPSDTFLAALLALGGVLVVTAAFYRRIHSVKGPGFEVGLAELSPDVKEKLTETAIHEAEAHGKPEEAPVIATTAEQMLINRLFPRQPYPLYPPRSPYQTTYAVGRPLDRTPAVSEREIQDVVSAAASEVVSNSAP